MNLNRIELPGEHANLSIIQMPKFVIQPGPPRYVSSNNVNYAANSNSNMYRSKRALPHISQENNETHTSLNLNLDNLTTTEFNEQIDLYQYENTGQLRFIENNNLANNICINSNSARTSHQHLTSNVNEQCIQSSNYHLRQEEQESIESNSQHLLE